MILHLEIKKSYLAVFMVPGASFGDALLGLSDSNKKYAKKKPTLEKEKPRSSTSKASNSERPKTKSDRQDPSSFSNVKSAKLEVSINKYM